MTIRSVDSSSIASCVRAPRRVSATACACVVASVIAIACGEPTNASGAKTGGVDNAQLMDEKQCAPLPDTFVYQPRKKSGATSTDSDEVTLAPQTSLRMARQRGTQVPMPCEVQLPCSKGNAYNVDDVVRALSHADVKTALADGGDYGTGDDVFTLSQGAGGTKVRVGAQCTTPSATCRGVPSGLSQAVEVLTGVYEYALRQPACSILTK